MSDQITPAQIRGARGMLDWSMTDLARAARLSVSTIKRIETAGLRLASESAHDCVQAALEAAGMCFLDDTGEGPGLRLRSR